MAVYCSACKATIPRDAQFCSECGVEFEPGVEVATAMADPTEEPDETAATLPDEGDRQTRREERGRRPPRVRRMEPARDNPLGWNWPALAVCGWLVIVVIFTSVQETNANGALQQIVVWVQGVFWLLLGVAVWAAWSRGRG